MMKHNKQRIVVVMTTHGNHVTRDANNLLLNAACSEKSDVVERSCHSNPVICCNVYKANFYPKLLFILNKFQNI